MNFCVAANLCDNLAAGASCRSKVKLINAKAALLCDKLAEFGPDKQVESQARYFECSQLHDHFKRIATI